MNKYIAAAAILLSMPALADEPVQLEVNGQTVSINKAHFKPITKPFAKREVEVGYEALIDVANFNQGSALIIESNGEVKTNRSSGNFGVTTRFYCSGTPIAMSRDFGYREQRKSRPAKPDVEEIRFDVPHCSQLKIVVMKEGSLSRQFYTRIEQINFNVSLASNDDQGEE